MKLRAARVLGVCLFPAVLSLAACAPQTAPGSHDGFDDLINGHGLALGCSWYCGAPAVSVLAGSDSAEALHDGDEKTVWIAREGAKSIITFQFDLSESDNVSGIGTDWVSIINGDARSEKKWKAHARAKTLKIRFNGKLMRQIQLADAMEPQRFDLPRMLFAGKRVNEVSFEVVDTYPGTSSQAVALADFYFSGFGLIH